MHSSKQFVIVQKPDKCIIPNLKDKTMENKNNNNSGCLIIIVIIILIALSNMKENHKKQTDALQDEIRHLRNELELRK